MLDSFSMRSLNTSPAEPNRSHWFVKNNYRIRAGAFFLMLVGLSPELWHRGSSAVTWSLVVLQLVVYPRVLYWLAMRAPLPHRAEVNNLYLDSFLIGSWVAALGFPLWPSFTLWLASSLNITASKGLKGLRRSTLAFFTGLLLSVAVFGFRFLPDTVWQTTAIMIIGISLYPLAIGNVAYERNQQLRATREKLRVGEQTLNSANQSLHEKLAEIQILQAQLKEQAIRDPLTGLFNRRYLDTVAKSEVARCEREAQPLCLMMMDIDHFKQINDTYGHQGGDEVLKALAKLLSDSVRVSDVACRYGGEEFLLLLPNMPPDIALLRAEQWRAAFAAITVHADGIEIKATLSIGISCYPNDGSSVEDLTRAADVALYRAKAEGRNRVVLCRANAATAALATPNGQDLEQIRPGVR
jgi:diguanylate cyclase